jgi:putative transposase
LRPLYD